MRVLGIDPALRNTGYGVIEVSPGPRYRALAHGVIRAGNQLRPSQCLVRIHDGVAELVEQHQPTVAAVEAVIYLQNYRTAITLGAARGAALLVLSALEVPVYEYAPRRVKSAATGRGGAQKSQVAFMMRAMLGLEENPAADAADALAVALAHAQAKPGLSQGVLL